MRRRLTMAGLIMLAAFASVQQVSQTTATVPINFVRGTVTGAGFATANPTSLEIGPDGRLYVADGSGRIQSVAGKNALVPPRCSVEALDL